MSNNYTVAEWCMVEKIVYLSNTYIDGYPSTYVIGEVPNSEGTHYERDDLAFEIRDEIRILHIEDDPAFSELVADFLNRERDHFSIVSETDAREGIDRVDCGIDCVVCDYDMPMMNGLEVLREVRADHPNLPFILFTGKGSEEIASEAISVGVTEYLQKEGGTDQYTVLANRIEQAVARRRAEQQMQRGFRGIETASEGIAMLDEDGEFIYLNEAYADLLGYERDELIGESFEVLFRDKDLHLAYDEIIPKAKEGEWRGQNVFLGRDGETIPVNHALSFASDNTMICTISKTEDEVRETLSVREQAMDEAPLGIVISDPHREDNPTIYANDGFVELTGYPRNEIVGRNCRFLQGKDTEEERVAEIRRAIESQEPVTVELRNYRKNGEMFWNRVTITPLFDENGELYRFVGFQEDVTARRELLEQHESLASIISHDLETPLSTLRGRLELATETGDLSHVEEALSAMDRMENIVDDIGDVLASGSIVDTRETVDVGEVSESVWRALDDGSMVTSIEESDSPTVRGDTEAVRRMLDNLLGNSLEHGESPVNVQVGELDGGFYIEDNGPGIPEDIRSEVFEQGYSTKESGDKTGLGMASVYQIVLAHNWQIDIKDGEKLDGVRFEIQTEQ